MSIHTRFNNAPKFEITYGPNTMNEKNKMINSSRFANLNVEFFYSTLDNTRSNLILLTKQVTWMSSYTPKLNTNEAYKLTGTFPHSSGAAALQIWAIAPGLCSVIASPLGNLIRLFHLPVSKASAYSFCKVELTKRTW